MSRKLIDLTGQKFGKLTVIERANNIGKETAWKCLCDCGNYSIVQSGALKNGKISSCGCSKGNKKDLIGKRFGRLIILEQFTKNGKGYSKCLCDCGNIKEVRNDNLKNNSTISCGCYHKEIISSDLIGKRFGKLVVIKQEPSKDGRTQWLCDCDCGKQKVVSSNNLLTGDTKSCGCLISWKEEEIANFLDKQKIRYERQYLFEDLRDERPLRFDFAILFNNNILGLIEYQGEQHFLNSYYSKDKLKKHDKMKEDYCYKNNIPLLLLRKEDDIECKIQTWMKEFS